MRRPATSTVTICRGFALWRRHSCIARLQFNAAIVQPMIFKVACAPADVLFDGNKEGTALGTAVSNQVRAPPTPSTARRVVAQDRQLVLARRQDEACIAAVQSGLIGGGYYAPRTKTGAGVGVTYTGVGSTNVSEKHTS